MSNIENARCDAGAAKASRLFTAKYTPDLASSATPCAKCRRFYAPNLRTRGRQWSACDLSATRDPGRSCRWFDPVRVLGGSA